jgi:hypothetical protein
MFAVCSRSTRAQCHAQPSIALGAPSATLGYVERGLTLMVVLAVMLVLELLTCHAWPSAVVLYGSRSGAGHVAGTGRWLAVMPQQPRIPPGTYTYKID